MFFLPTPPTFGLLTDGSTADSAGLPNGPSVDGDSTSKQQSAPYDSLRLLAPNFDERR